MIGSAEGSRKHRDPLDRAAARQRSNREVRVMFSIIPYRSDCNLARRDNRGLVEDFANDFFRPFFADNFGMMSAQRPMKVDVRDEGEKFVLEADMPGMHKDDLKIEVDEGVLTISAVYNEDREQKDEEDKYVYRERRIGNMSRSFNLEGIREDDITASFKDGVLTLEMPKREPAPRTQAHAIEIEG